MSAEHAQMRAALKRLKSSALRDEVEVVLQLYRSNILTYQGLWLGVHRLDEQLPKEKAS